MSTQNYENIVSNKKAVSNDTAFLNSQVNYTPNEQKTQDKSEETMFPTVESWPEPVNGSELADYINNQLNTYLYLPKGASEVMTMWILHTYNVNLFDFSPRLCIVSPEKRCGKTTVLRMIEHLSYRPINVSNVTTAVLFRAIDAWKPTMLIDEADTFIQNNEELRGIINAGFQKEGKISRIETVGKTHKVKFFACYSPVGIAAIGSLPATILDRGIVITMKRKKRSDKINRLRTRDFKPTAQEICRKCLRFMLDNEQAIARTHADIPDCFNDRAADAWEALFTIAKAISPEWEKRFTHSALVLSKSTIYDDSVSVGDKLLFDIRNIFIEEKIDNIPSEQLVKRLISLEESPWAEYKNKGLTTHALASILKRYDIHTQTPRGYDVRVHRYFAKDFEDAFERYLTPLPSRNLNCATVPPNTDISDLPD